MRNQLPNVLTSLRFPLTGLFLYGWLQPEAWWHLLATLVFFAGMITDYIDGRLARRLNLVSKVGGFLDPLADKVLVISGFYAIYATPGFNWVQMRPWLLLALIFIMLRELGITVLRLVKVRGDTPLRTSIWGKVKTSTQMITLTVAFVGLNLREFSGLRLSWFEYLIGCGVVLSALMATVSGTVYLRAEKRANAG